MAIDTADHRYRKWRIRADKWTPADRTPDDDAPRNRRQHRCGRRTRRGLGLVDSMLALGVMIILGTTAGHIFTDWVERRISQAEARVLSAWADAGATWLLQNRDRLGQTARPHDITTNVQVDTAYGADGRTPHRNRTIRLWVRSTGTAARRKAELVAVASGVADPVPIPTAGDGIHAVGMVHMREGRPRVIGPALGYELGPFSRVAATGDMVAIRKITANAGDPYLHRVPVPGRPELNRMETTLKMEGQSVTGAGRIEADKIATTRIDGPMTVRGGLTVEGAMTVERNSGGGGGTITLPSMTIRKNLKAATVTATGVTTDTVNANNARIGNLNVTGGCTGC